jgi:hypothetical protein
MTHLTAATRCVVLIVIALGVLAAHVQDACAQTEKTMLHDDMHGQPVRSPYITPSEFENIRVGGKARLGALLIVASIDEAVRLLGTPNSRETVEINAGYFVALVNLAYDGLALSFLITDTKIYLAKLKTTSSEWPVQIGDTEVSPGMDASELSEVVRNAARPAEDNPAHSLSYLKLYDARATGQAEKAMNEHTTIEIKIDDRSGEVAWFRIERLI